MSGTSKISLRSMAECPMWETSCRVEELGSSHASVPAFSKVLSTQWSCFGRAVQSQSCTTGQHFTPIIKVANMMPLQSSLLFAGVRINLELLD